jgi:hypothetical protein
MGSSPVSSPKPQYDPFTNNTVLAKPLQGSWAHNYKLDNITNMTNRIRAPVVALAFALIATLAVSTTVAYAFSPNLLEKIDVDLTESQVSAFEEAHELRESGADRDEVKTFLEESGVDEDTIKEVKEAVREVRHEMREAVHAALENDDYNAFLTAIIDTPLADAIDSEADFETFKTAHELKESGDREGAAELLTELGIEKPAGHGHRGGHCGEGGFGGPNSSE